MDKPVTPDKCQTIYLNLLDGLLERTFSTPNFVRELWQTERCDQFHSLQGLRTDITKHMGEDALNRILLYQATPIDEEKALDTMIHYSRWTTRRLQESLDWPNWLRFHIWERPHFLSYVGLGSLGVATARVFWRRATALQAGKKSGRAPPPRD